MIFATQAGRAGELVAFEQVSCSVELELIELQRVGQCCCRFERLGANLQLCRQVLGQGLQFPGQAGIEITATGRVDNQGLLQLTFGSQCQLPGLPLHCGQLQLTFELQGPVTFRLQVALQGQAQVVALQLQAVDAQPCGGPVGRQLQIPQQVAVIQAQLTDLDLAQFDGDRQAQRRQLQRAVIGRCIPWGKRHVDPLGMKLIDTQGGAQQACRRPGQ
ncbi:hypothetical protein D3C76_981770 [compost metagenome]